MSTNDQPDELGGTHVSGTGWMYEGPNNEINKEVQQDNITNPHSKPPFF